MSLQFEPLIPMSLWLGLATIAAAVLGWYALRRPGVMSPARWGLSIALMTGALAIILGLLLNPILSHPLPPPAGKPVLTVLIDSSASMATADGEGAVSRHAAATRIASEIKRRVSGTFDVRLRAFDRSVRSIDAVETDLVPAGNSTDLSGAIRGAVGGDVAAGEAIVLLSDGIHNTGGGSQEVLEAVRIARAMDAPIFTRTIGGDAKQIDLSVELRSPQDLAIVGQRLPVSVRVNNAGYSMARANVLLTREGKEISRKTTDVAAGTAATVHFSVFHESAGVFPYEVRVEPLAGETSQSNNSAAYVLRVVAEPVRVLVLEGKPYWDNKFFMRSLVRDPAVAVDAVVKLTDKRLLRRVLTHKPADKSADAGAFAARDDAWQITTDPKEFLASPDRLRAYQIVVLGRDSESFLSKEAVLNLQDWIAQDGGSLVCYRGAPTAVEDGSLAKLLPVKWSPSARGGNRFRLNLTDRGERTEWFSTDADSPGLSYTIAGMPSLVSSAIVDSSKPLAVVLANSVTSDNASSPAVVYQPYGSGRVVVIEGAGMWRWAFLAPKFQEQQTVYGSLWHSLLRWLTSGAKLQPGQKYNLRADKVRFGGNEPATATVLSRENLGAGSLPSVELAAEAAGSPVTTFVPSVAGDETGVFRVNFGALPEGRYKARLAGSKEEDATAHVIFEVRSFDREQLDLRARPDLMKRIAEASGGMELAGDLAGELEKRVADYRAKTRPPQMTKEPAWDKWWLLVGVIGVWGVSWFVRRSGGLV